MQLAASFVNSYPLYFMPLRFPTAPALLKKASHMLAVTCLCLLWQVAQAEEIKSPNGQLTLQFTLQSGGVPTYHLTYKGRDVIKTSKLGFDLKNALALTSGFTVAEAKQRTFDESWQPV